MTAHQTSVPCAYYECPERTRKPHFLCAAHWLMRFDRVIIKCPECSTYRSADAPICENCQAGKNRQNGRQNRRARRRNQQEKPDARAAPA